MAVQPLEQRLAGARDAALDRSDGAATDRRSFLVGEAARAHENERGALAGRQLGERAVEITQLELAVVIGRHGQIRHRVAVLIRRLELAAPELRVVLVAHDREEPRFQVRAGRETFEIVEGAHEGLLNEVVRPHAVAAQRSRERVQLGHKRDHLILDHQFRLHPVRTFLVSSTAARAVPATGKLQLGTGLLLARNARKSSMESDSMNVPRQTAVYRVCARAHQWDVYQEPNGAPVASFDDKSAALTYAMDLARGRVSWQLLLMSRNDLPLNDVRH